ncbi:protein kinase-like domain, concanavalin A-like lectin/glucanase domain protein [Tanacetum coccineum]|uniref:Protein kinase-like domain, concanavalin A-like lectin/glucanase domain protein n=1 Tax=Tanacetum coccineum TaxID=301880 RepID=A0ABQ4X858_9ASTR
MKEGAACIFFLEHSINLLECLPAGSISTLEDLISRFLAQFFPPGRTTKLGNDILMFQQHRGESPYEVCTRFKDLLQKFPHHGIDLWLQVQIFYDHVNQATRRAIDHSDDAGQGDLFSSRCSMENPEQAFVDYESSRNNRVGENEKHELKTVKKEEGEWVECEPPLDLVATQEDSVYESLNSVYESLIEKMLSCSLNIDFRIDKGNPNDLKIPCMIGRKYTAKAYIDLDLPMNVMSLSYYNVINSQRYEHRGLKFVRMGMDTHVFICNMSYLIDFTIMEKFEVNIDHSLSQVDLVDLLWKKLGSGYHQKDRKPSQNDKTERGMEKTVQNQGQSPKMSKSESILKNQQSNRSRN